MLASTLSAFRVKRTPRAGKPPPPRFRFVLETMISQASEELPSRSNRERSRSSSELPPRSRTKGFERYVGGSVAAWLQGAAVHPRDLDLGTTRAGTSGPRLGSARRVSLSNLSLPLIGRPRASSGARERSWGPSRQGSGRAVGASGAGESLARSRNGAAGRGCAARDRHVPGTRSAPVASMDALVRAAEKGRAQSGVSLLQLIRERGADRVLTLDTLLGRSTLSDEERAKLVAATSA